MPPAALVGVALVLAIVVGLVVGAVSGLTDQGESAAPAPTAAPSTSASPTGTAAPSTSSPGTPPPSSQPPPSATGTAPPAPDTTDTSDDGWRLGSWRISNEGGTLGVDTTARNTSTGTRSADLVLYVYVDGALIATTTTRVTDVGAGESVSVSFVGSDPWKPGQKVLLLVATTD